MPRSLPSLKILRQLLDELELIDPIILDVRDHTTMTDFMIICSGRSSRHTRSIAETIMLQMKAQGYPAIHTSGLQEGDWIVIDFGDLILHVMQPDSRAYYNLEGLWQK